MGREHQSSGRGRATVSWARSKVPGFNRCTRTRLRTFEVSAKVSRVRSLYTYGAAVGGGGAASDNAEASSNDEPKWVELTLLKETEINNVKLSEGTVVSVEEKSSKKLVEDGYASLNEAEQTKEEADENKSEETVE